MTGQPCGCACGKVFSSRRKLVYHQRRCPTYQALRKRILFKKEQLRREARDAPYECGYNASLHSLHQVVAHWRSCKSAQCHESADNYRRFEREMQRKYGALVPAKPAPRKVG